MRQAEQSQVSTQFMRPFLVTALVSALAQCCILLPLWLVLPYKVLTVDVPGYHATFTSHSPALSLVSLAILWLLIMSSLLVRPRNGAIALGLFTSASVALSLFIFFRLQDAG